MNNDDYLLIFASHVMLFERRIDVTIDRLRINRPGSISDKYLRSPNIHIDLGSRLSTDMSYTEAADIYLGDVSSQVYDYLDRPRPCLLLNSHEHAWQDDPNFEYWKDGPVITRPEALATHSAQYDSNQQAMRDRSFDLSERDSSLRAAEAIVRFAGTSPAPATRLVRSTA